MQSMTVILLSSEENEFSLLCFHILIYCLTTGKSGAENSALLVETCKQFPCRKQPLRKSPYRPQPYSQACRVRTRVSRMPLRLPFRTLLPNQPFQSPWIWNLTVGLKNIRWATSASLNLYRLEIIHGLLRYGQSIGIKQQVVTEAVFPFWFRDITVKELQLYA